MSRSEFASGEAARVGEELRDARLALGVSLEETADRLRISRRYLAALEEGRVRDLPGIAYGTGFVRTYATAMGLPADDLVRRFRDASGGAVKHKADLVFPEPVPERGVPAGALMLVGVVLAIGAYVAWYSWSGSNSRTVDSVPALPSRLEPAAEQSQNAAREAAASSTPAPPAARPAPSLPAQPPAGAAPTPAPAGNGTAAAPGARPATPPGQPGAPAATPQAPVAGAPAAPPAGARPAVPGQAGTTAAAPPASPPAAPAPPALAPASPAPAAAPAADQGRITLRGTGESWVQIRDSRSGEVVLNRVLRNGDTFSVPNRAGLVLTTGKAQELSVEVDGQPTPALEGAVGVRRDLALDAERLKAQRPPR
jgi:cytoskeleton protein RodZ